MSDKDDNQYSNTGNLINDELLLKKLLHENKERLKELSCLNQATGILREGKSINETLQKICLILPKAWQYPENTIARISYDNQVFSTPYFLETPWVQKQEFDSFDNQKGNIEVFYTKKFPEIDEGPFLKEERHLINNISSLITGFINSVKAKDLLSNSSGAENKFASKDSKTILPNRQLLQRFLNKQNYNRDIYHDLQPFKVKEILLIANLYDAYSIEKEGRFAEHLLGEYAQLNLTSLPRITGVSSYEEANDQLHTKHFDLVILMMGVDKVTPIRISRVIKQEYPYIPLFLLVNNNAELSHLNATENNLSSIDKVFVWNGDSKIFFAMIKLIEDKVNLDNDTQVGLVRIILLVEDSPIYYSRYLPMLYSIVMEQTKRIIDDVSTDELFKVLRMKARPKIILASTYEESIEIFEKYKDNFLCLISDVEFSRNGKEDPQAGLALVSKIKEQIKDLPIIIQSSEAKNAELAYQLKATFINKNSESLLLDFKSFITHYLGFGNFIYRDSDGREIAVARSLKEFETLLRSIPDESLLYHGKRNHFSLWLMARGEIKIARMINPIKITDFDAADKLRSYLIDIIYQNRNEQNQGMVIEYEESEILDETNIVSLTSGSFGGKGRGLAFINTLIYNFDFTQLVPNINIRAPKTMIIGTDEFEYFIERNKLASIAYSEDDYEVIKAAFLKGKLTESLIKKLKRLVKIIEKPIAVRSSGLFEDSLTQPFAGIFETYLLPNSNPEPHQRLEQLMDAIKLVYASVFSKIARGYIEAIHYKIEEEKMAVILQEVVGNRYENVYYPHISGVAQSYNYYPYSHMKPEEGFAVCALGLGKYVVDGEKAHRFSPIYPNVEINSPKDQYKNSQVEFYAVDLAKDKINLLEGETAGLTKLEISTAENHGTLKHLASVYEIENSRIVPGITHAGPRIVNFSNILKYNYIPLAQTIATVLDIVKESMGSPVEIEFAVDLTKDSNYKSSFYLLQIKPLIGNAQDYEINLEEIDKSNVLLFSEKCMGNGPINDIYDVIVVSKETFDKSKTEEIASEIEKFNKEMAILDRKYLLIGPGRWGTRDRWIGIPVNWPQISYAKVIVETSLEDFPLDASSGSHFFHNVTSMNVGYLSVQSEISNSFIKWEVFDSQPLVKESKYVKHYRFENPLTIKMDGKKRIAVILF